MFLLRNSIFPAFGGNSVEILRLFCQPKCFADRFSMEELKHKSVKKSIVREPIRQIFFILTRSRNSWMPRPRISYQMSGVPIRSIPESFRFFWKSHLLQKRENRESVSFSVTIGFFWARFQGNSFDRTAASGLENQDSTWFESNIS